MDSNSPLNYGNLNSCKLDGYSNCGYPLPYCEHALEAKRIQTKQQEGRSFLRDLSFEDLCYTAPLDHFLELEPYTWYADLKTFQLETSASRVATTSQDFPSQALGKAYISHEAYKITDSEATDIDVTDSAADLASLKEAFHFLSNQDGFPQLIAIVGPTASGKTALADLLAYLLNSSVLSFDSMQIYKDMNIATAKAKPDELKAPLLGIDLIEASESYSVQQYQNYGRDIINKAISHSKTLVLCGGTGLYLNSLVDNLNFIEGEQVNNELRDRYEAYLLKHGAQRLHELLASVDQESANCIHPQNTKRVIRALEMADKGISYAQQLTGLHDHKMLYDCAFIGCAWQREALYERINKRVELMFDEGLLKEFEMLENKGVFSSLTACQAIGYKELLEHRDDLRKAQDLIAQRSRRYAKRQLSWFYRDNRVQWFNCQDTSLRSQLSSVFFYLYEISKAKLKSLD